ncbi:MAG: hypothetical protein LBJ91_03210, partial [Clostridiales Family XIII bacterium]|nr:hypothetical protein [Clostridiales Family XIII bacterium]
MLIGRASEKSRLINYYHSSKAEFVVIYGRRRVGKTHLIRETFGNDFFFYFTGTTTVHTAAGQLERFTKALSLKGVKPRHKIKNWNEAFDLLT